MENKKDLTRVNELPDLPKKSAENTTEKGLEKQRPLGVGSLCMNINLRKAIYRNGQLDENEYNQKKDIEGSIIFSDITKLIAGFGFIKSPSLQAVGAMIERYEKADITLEVVLAGDTIEVKCNRYDQGIEKLFQELAQKKLMTEENTDLTKIDEMLDAEESHAQIGGVTYSGDLLLFEKKDKLLTMLASGNTRLKRAVVKALAKFQMEDVQDVLEELMYNADEQVSWNAAIGVARYGNEKTLKRIKQLLTPERKGKILSPERKWVIASMMMKFHKDKSLKPLLIEGLKSQNTVIRNLAIVNLARLGEYKEIIPFLKDKNPAIREAAITSLCTSVDPQNSLDEVLEPSPELLEHRDAILQDEDKHIRKLGKTLFEKDQAKKEHKIDFDTLQRVKNGLMGVAIGDAFGAPIEFLKEQDIKEQYGEKLTDYQYNKNRPVVAGQFTDDTEETLLLARSIMISGYFEPNQFARLIGNHMFAIDNDKEANTGYGHNTMKTARALYAGVNWRLQKAKFKTCGSAMRTYPIAVTEEDENVLLEQLQDNSQLTHPGVEAIAGSVVAGLAYHYVLQNPDITGEQLLEKIISAAANVGKFDTKMLAKLEKLKEKISNLNEMNEDQILEISGGNSSVASESIIYALALFLKYRKDPITALNKATVNDGDSDSIGAITAGLIGLSGEKLPDNLVAHLSKKSQIEHFATGICV